MQTSHEIGNSGAATEQSAKYSGSRTLIAGVCIALLGGAAMALSTTGTSQVPTNLAVSSIEGNVIVAFDAPASSLVHPRYRVDCSAVNGANVTASAEAAASPVVVGGLATGEEYDCRARMTADAGTSKSVRVRVMGQD